MEAKFLDSLSGGDSANGTKLCLGLTEGDFWSRPAGAALLYQGQDINDVDFDSIIATSNINGDIEISSGQPLSQTLCVLRRINCCGLEEKTISAAVLAEFDVAGDIVQRSCNKIFMVSVRQIEGNKILLKWFYQPLQQAKKISSFKIYSDNGTGIIDFENPVANISYVERKFYEFITNELSDNNYKFCVRAAAEDDSDDGWTGQINFELNRQSPENILIIQSGVV